MEKSNTFRYKGVEVNFNGFYEDKFCFYIIWLGRMVMVKSIEELESYFNPDGK